MRNTVYLYESTGRYFRKSVPLYISVYDLKFKHMDMELWNLIIHMNTFSSIFTEKRDGTAFNISTRISALNEPCLFIDPVPSSSSRQCRRRDALRAPLCKNMYARYVNKYVFRNGHPFVPCPSPIVRHPPPSAFINYLFPRETCALPSLRRLL